MTTMLQTPTPSKQPIRPAAQRGRAITAVVLILSLVCSGIMRQVAANRQKELVNIRGTVTGRSTLGNMDSFALALLLGGLRGPLVMILWPAIENQKVDRNLEDIDTMIEWVRLLQPEFDTVHLFQIWNKAYNVSVMMSSPANKYTVIMEALDYAESVDRERPGDINILDATMNVYAGKLGSTNLAEFPFYSRQFREESMTDARRKEAYPADVRFERISKWKPLLDGDNQIRADLLKPARARPAELPAGSEWNDGSELQYLNRYSPFPFGISPLAMSYNYAKRAEVAQSVEGQQALQVSAMVIDSQPPLQLKFWQQDEARHARAAEAAAFAVPRGSNTLESETRLAGISPRAQCADRVALDQALYNYALAARLSRDAIVEYERHLAKPQFAMRRTIYDSHIAEMQCASLVDSADRDYLLATVAANADDRTQLLKADKRLYGEAVIRLERTALEFFTEETALLAKGSNIPGGSVLPPPKPGQPEQDRQRVFMIDESLISGVFEKAMQVAMPMNGFSQERQNYTIAVARCRIRMSQIDQELSAHAK